MKNIYDETMKHRELTYTLALDYSDWKLAMGCTPSQVHRSLRETLEVAKVNNLNLPSRAIYGWYNIGRSVAQKAIAARRTATRLLTMTYENSYWYIRSVKVAALLRKIKQDPNNTWHNNIIRIAIINLGIHQEKQERIPLQLTGSLLLKYKRFEKKDECQGRASKGKRHLQLANSKESHSTWSNEQGRFRRALQEIDPYGKRLEVNNQAKLKDEGTIATKNNAQAMPDKFRTELHNHRESKANPNNGENARTSTTQPVENKPDTSVKEHYIEQNWHITSRNWNKLMHALHGNGSSQDENQAKQEALTEEIMNAIKGHPGYNGKPLGNLVKWIKQLVATKQFRDQCASTAHQKPNALAQYAIQQAQWISEQASNAWSLKKAAEKGKGKSKGTTNQGYGQKGGKGQSKGKNKEKGVPWAQLLFQPVEFEMSREQEPQDALDDMSDELQPMWIQPPRIDKDSFQHGAQGLAFLTTSDFQAKARLALEDQNQALAALLPISKNAFEKQFIDEQKGDFANHDWRAQEITLTATNKETQLPELKAALLVQFGGHVVRVINIKPDVVFNPSEKIEVLVVWELTKYAEQPTREEMKTAIEKATSTGITELYTTGPATNRKTQIQYGWQCICKMTPEVAAEYMKAAGKNDIYAKYFTRQGKTAPIESTPIPMPTSVTKAEAVQLGSTLLG